MTKQQIIDELKTYGIEATLRPRKSTLVALLNEVRENGVDPTSPVTMLDDIHEYAMENDSDYAAMMHKQQAEAQSDKDALHVSTEEWMDFTKVDHKMNKSETALVFCVGFLIVMHIGIVIAALVG